MLEELGCELKCFVIISWLFCQQKFDVNLSENVVGGKAQSAYKHFPTSLNLHHYNSLLSHETEETKTINVTKINSKSGVVFTQGCLRLQIFETF